MTVQYARFYSFPFLIFRMSPAVYVIAGAVTLLAALLGAFGAVRSAFALPAAVAMRPPAPPVYRQFLDGAFARLKLFSQLTTMALRHLVRHPVRSALTTLGTAAGVALVAMAMGTIASLDLMIDVVFFRTDRQDASLLFAAEQSDAALYPVARLPGVLVAEPFLDLPARLSNGQFSRRVAITGRPPSADLSRVLDLSLAPVPLPQSGLVLGDRLAMLLDVSAGDRVRVDFLTGARRSVEVPVAEVIQSFLGLAATMDIDALARLSGTGPRISGAHLAIDPLRLDDLYAAVKDTPEVASVALQSVARVRFQETMQENVLVMIGIYLTLAVIIAFGVVYNSARIQLSERARELATLRVLGFGRGEVARVLFVETGIIIALAQPLGWGLGAALGYAVTGSLASDLFRVPFEIAPDIFAIASLVVVGAALVSALIVGRRVARLDLVRVLKTRE
jgi:putative ABC transport system permease protein